MVVSAGAKYAASGMSSNPITLTSSGFLRAARRRRFTVEYSIRSAQNAVYGLLGLNRKPPPVYRGAFHPRVLDRAFRALHDKVA